MKRLRVAGAFAVEPTTGPSAEEHQALLEDLQRLQDRVSASPL